ncbi:MAG: hypothetical protein ACKER6_01190 [Candidatus Hodgkinia cicadicola]
MCFWSAWGRKWFGFLGGNFTIPDWESQPSVNGTTCCAKRIAKDATARARLALLREGAREWVSAWALINVNTFAPVSQGEGEM